MIMCNLYIYKLCSACNLTYYCHAPAGLNFERRIMHSIHSIEWLQKHTRMFLFFLNFLVYFFWFGFKLELNFSNNRPRESNSGLCWNHLEFSPPCYRAAGKWCTKITITYAAACEGQVLKAHRYVQISSALVILYHRAGSFKIVFFNGNSYLWVCWSLSVRISKFCVNLYSASNCSLRRTKSRVASCSAISLMYSPRLKSINNCNFRK